MVLPLDVIEDLKVARKFLTKGIKKGSLSRSELSYLGIFFMALNVRDCVAQNIFTNEDLKEVDRFLKFVGSKDDSTN
jgi:hypothetical protein